MHPAPVPVVFIPDCGHLPTLERPAECAAVFQRFLDGLTGLRPAAKG